MTTPPAPNAIEIEILPGRALARVFSHEVAVRSGRVACWTYVTQGLAALGQPELALSLRRAPEARLEMARPEPLHLLATIAQLAADGRVVGPGDYTELGPRGFLRSDLRGFAYQIAQPLDGVVLPPGTLSCIGLLTAELEVAKRFGALRVLARLGRDSAFFPTALWCDPERTAVASPDEASILDGVASALFPGVTVTLQGRAIHLVVPRRVAPQLAEALPSLPANAALALLATLAPDADACLVWSPGQVGAQAISPAGSQAARMAGNFLLLVPEQRADGGNPFEDGFAYLLTDASHKLMRWALGTGTAVELAADGGEGKSLQLSWSD